MKRFLPLLPALTVLAACAGDTVAPPVEDSSFARIQSEIFDVSCVSCHTAGSQYAIQSGLVLDRAVAYQNLVGAESTNKDAKSDKLRRVTPFKPDSSLLYQKLNWQVSHAGRDYGTAMPLGGPALSVGQLEFVRRWILGGALRNTDTIATALLTDRTQQDLTPFVPLPLPASGYQLKIEPFGIAPHFERELFTYRSVGNTKDVYVNRIETRMRPNSHHFVIYSFNSKLPAAYTPQANAIRDIRRPDGSLDLLAMAPMGYHVFVGGAMTANGDWRFPAGIALKLPANAMLDLNSHYVNRTDGEMPGEIYTNLHTVDASQVQHEAFSLNLSNTNINLPAKTRTTLTRSFTMSQKVNVILLTSHMHEHGEKFSIRVVGGTRNELVYETSSWNHPDITTFDTPIVVNAGESIRSEITYNNTTDKAISFGLTSQDEMGIIFGYYYCSTACTPQLGLSSIRDAALHQPLSAAELAAPAAAPHHHVP